MKARTLILTAGAALALAVPSAQAMPLYPEGDGPAASTHSARSLSAVRPDDRAGIRGVGTAVGVTPAEAVRPNDRPGPLGIGETPVAVVGSSPSSGFDWRNTGIGIGSAGVLLLLGASLAATSRRRSASALG